MGTEERLVPFIRKCSVDWDFVRGQLLEISQDDKLYLKSWCQKIISLLEVSSGQGLAYCLFAVFVLVAIILYLNHSWLLVGI